LVGREGLEEARTHIGNVSMEGGVVFLRGGEGGSEVGVDLVDSILTLDEQCGA